MPDPSKNVDSIFVPDWQTLVGLVLIVAIGSVANTAGVGGGAIFVPIFQALIGFGLKESTALSQALITAGAAVSVLLNLFSPSPVEPWLPLINFSLLLLLLPVLLVGVGVGVLLNIILPSYIISILLFLLMCLLIVQSLSKGISMWRMESRKKAQAECSQAKADEQRTEGCDVDSSQEQQQQQQEQQRENVSLIDFREISEAVQQPAGSGGLEPSLSLADRQASHPVARCREAEDGAGGSSGLEAGAGRTSAPGLKAGAAGGRRVSRFGTIQDWRHFRPDPTLLPSRMLARDAPGSWCNRRNAWLVRFVHACNELGAESPAPPATPAHPKAQLQPPPPPPSSSRPCLLQRSLSMPRSGVFEPLLSPEDSVAALAPHGRMRLPREQWERSLGCTEEELLEALSGSALRSCARDAPAAAAIDEAAGWGESPGGRGGDASLYSPLLPGPAVWRGEAEGEGPGSVSARLIAAADTPDGAADVDVDDVDDASSCCCSEPRTGPGVWARLSAHVGEGWDRLPKTLLLLLLACWVVYLALQLGRTLSRACSAPYWSLFALQLFAMPAFSVAAALWLERQRRRQGQVHVQELELICTQRPPELAGAGAAAEEQPEREGRLAGWSTFFMYQALALTAGIVGGLLGLGGGMVIGPVLLELGVQPQVSSATSSAMVLFSSSTALVSLAALGMLNLEYAAVFSLASMLASVLGVLVVGRAIQRTGRVSLVVLALASVMLIGGCAVGGFGIVTVMDAIRSGQMGPAPLCPA